MYDKVTSIGFLCIVISFFCIGVAIIGLITGRIFGHWAHDHFFSMVSRKEEPKEFWFSIASLLVVGTITLILGIIALNFI